ncbi:acyl-CoA carboxylase epsilon subunit [Kitasatospora sp. A2-31]|uniref:acyl-CoA carboxylase epsilon subunit n=1 Tax=Kitasatospora sp. A2-31 TaxID=2916414 RepID=UPI001EEB1368|nr:acyl-CoA carboxylase epsilon subunit [Kitasatospora sp. A2-31]MCG6495267.1 hypothetical protein [Kitasatospora sp. A2-31]
MSAVHAPAVPALAGPEPGGSEPGGPEPAGPEPGDCGPRGPVLRVLRGRPTGDELAVLAAVLTAVLAPAVRRAATVPPVRPAPPARWERAEPRPVHRP